MNSCLKFNIANIPSSFVFDSDNISLKDEVAKNISPCLAYSCQNWSHHLSSMEVTTSEAFPHILSDFLKVQVLFWIEAMNLLGSQSQCDSMLRMAWKWVMKGTKVSIC